MAIQPFEPRSRPSREGPSAIPAPGEGRTPDRGRVVVVGNSEITRIVVSRIVERAGLKSISALPDAAARLLVEICPGVVVMDGGAGNRECDCLFPGIEALRRVMGGAGPRVVLLSTANGSPQSLGLHAVVDAVVAKPITPERLQPVVERLLGRA